jgi:hypothetical protein
VFSSLRAVVATLLLLLCCAPDAAAEWQLKPFGSLTFGGGTTFLDLDQTVGSVNPAIGVSGVLLGNVIGIEGDFAYGPGFFEPGDQRLVQKSSVTTLTGNLVIAVPRRLAAYTLRPYVAVGVGLMHVRIEGVLDAVLISSTLPAADLGGGVTGFLTDRIGVSWDVRYFGSLRRGRVVSGITIGGEEELSFWRASMALAIRY